jgi:hypothetical protein
VAAPNFNTGTTVEPISFNVIDNSGTGVISATANTLTLSRTVDATSWLDSTSTHRFVSGAGGTWQTAFDSAITNGGHLATLETNPEWNTLFSYGNAKWGNVGWQGWLGLEQSSTGTEPSGGWHWSTGSTAIGWAGGYPNNGAGTDNGTAQQNVGVRDATANNIGGSLIEYENPMFVRTGLAGQIDIMTGSAQADVISGMGGADVLSGMAGDDRFLVPDTAFGSINGGTGFDVIEYTAAATIVGSTLDSKVTDVEGLYLGAGTQTLSLSVADVRGMSTTTDTLYITRSSVDDVVTFNESVGTAASQWHNMGTANGIITYQYFDAANAATTTKVLVNELLAIPLTFTSMSIDLATASDNGVSTTDNITSNTAPTINGTATGLSVTDAAAATAGTVTANLFDDKNDNGLYDAGDSILAVNIPLIVTGTNSTFAAHPTLLGGTYNTKAILVDQAGNSSVAGLLDNSGTAEVVVDWTAAPSVVVDNQTNDGLGYAMANAGDFNGDGYADFIVTAPHNQSSSFDIGVRKSDMYIVYGSASGLTNFTDIDTMAVAQGIHITSTAIVGADIAQQGLVTSAIGDLNGDGYADVAIGSHRDDSLYVVFGRGGNSAATFDLHSIELGATTNGFHIDNWATGAWMATGLSGGDVNGDGYGDLMFGSSDGLGNGLAFTLYGHAGVSGDASWSNLYATANEGLHVKGVLGAYGAPLDAAAYTSLKTTYDPTGPTHDIDSDLGDRITVISDINGDGYNDYIVTAPRADTTTSFDAGSAYLLFGTARGLGSGFDLGNLSPSQGVRLNGTENYEYLGGSTLLAGGIGDHGDALWGMGASVSNIGDINADGIADFAIGSPTWGDQVADAQSTGRTYIVYGKGAGMDWSDINLGSLGTQGFIIQGAVTDASSNLNFNTTHHDQLGFSVSNGGDVNGDGIDDFLIGAPGETAGVLKDYAGAAYLVFGQAGGTGFLSTTGLDVLVTTHKAIRFAGVNADDYAGTGVTIGDWNGDGIADVSYGIWENGATNTGSYQVYNGATSNLTQTFTTGNNTLAAGIHSGSGPVLVAGVDRISGGQGNDTITGIGTDTTNTVNTTTLHDVAYGGAGDDTVTLAGMSFTRVDGGLGIDTLTLAGTSSLSLNIAEYGNRVKGFEKFDLGVSDGVGNNLSLRLSDVLNETSSSVLGHMEVTGGAGDTVQLNGTGTWTTATTATATGITFDVYHNSNLDAANKLGDVWIQQGMAVL